MSKIDFSSDDSILDEDYVVHKQKIIKKVYRKPSISTDILFKEYFEVMQKVSTALFSKEKK